MRPIDDPVGDLDLESAASAARTSRPADLTDPDVLEEMLARPLGAFDGDHLPTQPQRRNLQSKLDAIREKERRRAEVDAATPQQIVDSIPRRHF